MKFGVLVTDIPVYVPCKFEMYIFKVALVISENVRIAFLYVLSMFTTGKLLRGLANKQYNCSLMCSSS